MPDGIKISGYVILFVGVGLLVFTFFNAYLFLRGILGIAASSDLTEVFGQSLAPLIEACIRAIYLGIMGWIGSILTIRGVHFFSQIKHETKAEVKPEAQVPAQPSPQPTAESKDESFAQSVAQIKKKSSKKKRKGKKE